ncbi:hypothetical protein U9M48_015765, partial [Paspalum notatum var. saurae]
VARPKPLGGLSIPDLRLFSIALQARWFWLQRTDEERVWAGLPVRVAAEVRHFFDVSILVKVGNGKKTLFWLDRWMDGQALCALTSVLASAVSRRDLKSLTVADGLTDVRWIRGITGGLTVAVIEEYIGLWVRRVIAGERVSLQENVEDQVVWRWTADGKYSAKSVYLALHHGAQEFLGHRLIWQTWLTLRVKIFLWLAFRRRLWTADRRRRHGLDARDVSFLCDALPESIDHLLVSCSFSRPIWIAVLSKCGVLVPPNNSGTLLQWWEAITAAWPAATRRGGDTIVGLVSWCI